MPKNTERRRCVHKNAHAVNTAQGQALWRSLLNRPEITAEQIHSQDFSSQSLTFSSVSKGCLFRLVRTWLCTPWQGVLLPLLPRCAGPGRKGVSFS